MQQTATFLARMLLILLVGIGLSQSPLFAQMRVGLPTTSPDGSAALDISSGPYSTGNTYRGIAPPKVALIQSIQSTPINKPTVGLLVYNTATQGDLTPGYYYWDGAKWLRFSTTSAGAARVAAAGGGQSIPAYLLSEVQALSTTTPPDNIILVEPGREGLFRYFPGDTTSANNGTVLVTAAGKRYKRAFSGPVNVRWFGAKGDGVNDETSAIQSTILYAYNSGIKSVIFPAGSYISTSTITVKKGVSLIGQFKLPGKSSGDPYAILVIKTPQNLTTSAYLLETGAGMRGFTFNWPLQVATLSNPIPYGWAITSGATAASADNIHIEDIMLTNANRGINMDYGGQWNIRNIFGQCFDMGIRIDRMFDASRLENVHFWIFGAGDGTPLGNYARVNGRVIVVGKADALQMNNLFAYGHKNLIHFTNFGNGTMWGHASNLLADVCTQPIFIESANILQLINANGTNTDKRTGRSFIETGTDVGGDVSITNLYAYGTQTLVNIKSQTGTFKLTNITGRKRGEDLYDVVQYKVINQAIDQASVKVTIDEADYNEVSGNVQIGPMNSYSADSDITSSIPNFASPHLWSFATSRVTAITGGSSFNLNGSIQAIRQTLPSSMIGKPKIFLLECDIQQKYPQNLLFDGQFYLRLTDANINDVILPGNSRFGYFTDKTHLKVPFIVRGGTATNLDFVFGNNSDPNPCVVELTNLKLSEMSATKITQSHLDWLHIKQPNSLGLPGLVKGQREYVNVSMPTTIDPSQTEYVSVVVGAGVTNTVTLSTTNWPKGKIIWVSRYDSNQTGTLVVAVSTGQIQNTSQSFIGSSFTYPSNLGSAGFVYDGANIHCVSF